MASKLQTAIGSLAMAAGLIAPALADVTAFSDGLTGAYVGGGVGDSWIDAGTAGLGASIDAPYGDFDAEHFGYQLVLGVRPPSAPLALELEYFDLGTSKLPSSYAGPLSTFGSVAQRGEGLFLMLYLPMPIVEVYAKAGASRITTHANIYSCLNDSCELAAENPTNDAFAAGVGVQWTLGPWALRGEYEHFNAGGGHPGLLTADITWSFL